MSCLCSPPSARTSAARCNGKTPKSRSSAPDTQPPTRQTARARAAPLRAIWIRSNRRSLMAASWCAISTSANSCPPRRSSVSDQQPKHGKKNFRLVPPAHRLRQFLARNPRLTNPRRCAFCLRLRLGAIIHLRFASDHRGHSSAPITSLPPTTLAPPSPISPRLSHPVLPPQHSRLWLLQRPPRAIVALGLRAFRAGSLHGLHGLLASPGIKKYISPRRLAPTLPAKFLRRFVVEESHARGRRYGHSHSLALLRGSRTDRCRRYLRLRRHACLSVPQSGRRRTNQRKSQSPPLCRLSRSIPSKSSSMAYSLSL